MAQKAFLFAAIILNVSSAAHAQSSTIGGVVRINFTESSVSIGDQAGQPQPAPIARGQNALAIGNGSAATADNATVLGAFAEAQFQGSTAIGTGASTTGNNQVTIGSSASKVRLGGYTNPGVLVNDASGNVSTNTVLLPAVASLQSQVGANTSSIAQLESGLGGLQSLSASHSAQLDTLFDLTSHQRDETRKGIALASSIAQPHFPSAAGRTSYASNVGIYRGEVAFSAGIMHRMEGDFGVTASVSFAGHEHAAIKAGVAGEF